LTYVVEKASGTYCLPLGFGLDAVAARARHQLSSGFVARKRYRVNHGEEEALARCSLTVSGRNAAFRGWLDVYQT